MKRLINNAISVGFSLVKFSIIKLLHWKQFVYHPIERFSPNTDVYFLGNEGQIKLGNRVRAHSLSKLRVIGRGVIIIGDNATMNYGCMVNARELIHIGKGVEFGPNVLIYDHDHDFRSEGGLKAGKYLSGVIEIGDNTWVGANVVLLRNTKIGKNCVVAAGCILGNCEYPDNTLIYQKRDIQTKIISKK